MMVSKFGAKICQWNLILAFDKYNSTSPPPE